MFALGVRYLNGWAMAAADGASKRRVEWPPHPDRLFMALAAAWFETGQDPLEEEVLRFLERLSPPSLHFHEAEQRMSLNGPIPAHVEAAAEPATVTHFVPVNDTKLAGAQKVRQATASSTTTIGDLKNTGLGVLPELRLRQPRGFPVAVPRVSQLGEMPVCCFIWGADLDDQRHDGLSTLCRKVVSLGHSASFVQVWLKGNPPAANLVPISGRRARYRLRVPDPGRLDDLDERYNRRKCLTFIERRAEVDAAKGKAKKALEARLADDFPNGKPRSLRPVPRLWQGYDRPEVVNPATSTATQSIFDPRLLILKLTTSSLPLVATLRIAGALRGLVLRACVGPIPEWISGHTPDGQPSTAPHAAFLSLPFVGSAHADGRITGVALAIPRSIDDAEVGRVIDQVLWHQDGRLRTLTLFDGNVFECKAEVESRETPQYNLRAETWTRPARRWASVTPIVLDRHHKGQGRWDQAAETVKDSCERIGLPRPIDVLLSPVAILEGVPHSKDFPLLQRKRDGGRLQHTHATILFDKDVQGPLLVGAGRYRGYGLCRPLRQGGDGYV